MKTGNYSILEILEYPNLDQLIIPEIQRDYVWDVNDVLDLLKSIRDGFEGDKVDKPYLGFIYAYTDKDYVYKYFLIDGQQRMTSIYLLLLACHQKMGKKLPNYLLNQDKIKLDYKVRQATHDFLTDFVNHCHNNPDDYDFKIENQIWYYKAYQNDRTIFNIIQNYNAIKDWLNGFEQEQLPKFLKFVEDEVELSYFPIENGREGEELYIYMNSRGRHLEANETLKATFLSKVEPVNKIMWGKKWEYWQDFFWKHRGNSPDADSGFIEFLKMIQIINMCELSKSTNDNISLFASGRGKQKLDIKLLPDTLDEIDKYFESYKWFIESEKVLYFFSKYKENEILTTYKDHRQIDYLRILPVLFFLKETGLRDEQVIIRFVRFFFNVARKENVSKDIAGQLPISIKLMIEYSKGVKGKFDVCDLIDYQGGRTLLIDKEEVFKLNMFKIPPIRSTRQELESLFWEAEDHFIFNGEIMFLLGEYINKEKNTIDLPKYRKTWSALKTLFPTKTNPNNAMITRVLLYYGETWVQDTPYYYTNYNCQSWYKLVRIKPGKYLLALLEDMHGNHIDHMDVIFKRKAKQYFKSNNLTSIDSLKSEETLFGQVRLLATIDYYSEKKLWEGNAYIAQDKRFKYEGDIPFFSRDIVIYNISRYIKDGSQGRVIPMLNDVLNDEAKLNQILANILNITNLDLT
jgi:uncharacterized protein with ParB-like and HNH nuclease domain